MPQKEPRGDPTSRDNPCLGERRAQEIQGREKRRTLNSYTRKRGIKKKDVKFI